MASLRSMIRNGSAALVLAGLVGMCSLASAGTKTSAPAKPAPAAKPAASSSRPAGGSGSASHGTGAAGSASHGPTAGGSASHGPTANGSGSHGPTANGPSANGAGANGAGAHGNANAGGAHAAGGAAAGGGHLTNTSHTAIKNPAPKGSAEHATKSGSAVRTRPNGRVSDVHDAKRGMDVHHGLNGNRRVSVERADHSRMVSERGRPGYVQRGYNYHGHDFGRRAYYYHGREYNRYYRGYGYRGVYLNVYAPGYYYAPAFYGWAYNPWAMPIAFGWGWAGNPWYGFYGGYFAPYPVYPSASYWLTDYIISQDLQAAYAAHQEAGEVDGAQLAPGGAPELTPDVKQQIADEVRNQLALENAEAQQTSQKQDVDPGSSGIARLLADGHPHVFVAGGAVDVVDANGQECGISDGDVLQLQTPPPTDATAANLVVMASKGGNECQKSSTVTVQLTDLQEMQNSMRETIDQGLQDLQAKQGKGGLPQAPPSAQAQPTEPEYAAVAPPPDPKDAADLQQQGQQADLAEKEVTAEASQDSGTPISAAPAAPTSVELGQSTDQVQAALGSPARVANLGPKTIYYYSGMKVVFKDGKVTDVQ